MKELAVSLAGWQLFIALAISHKLPKVDLRLPTEEEIKAMLKECYRRFREAIKKQKEQG